MRLRGHEAASPAITGLFTVKVSCSNEAQSASDCHRNEDTMPPWGIHTLNSADHDTNKHHTVLGCDDKRCTPAFQQAHESQAAYCQLLAHSHPSFRTTTAAASLQRCAQTRPPKHLQALLAPRWWPVLAPHCRSALPGLLGQLLGWRGPGRDPGSPCPAAGRRGASAGDTQHGSEGEGWALRHIFVAEPPVLCRS